MLSILSQRALKYSMLGFLKLMNKAGVEAQTRPTELYFGYGANLKVERFKKYSMQVEPIGVAKLNGYKLAFNLACEFKGKGFAGLKKGGATDEVWGTLVKISPLSLKMLDILEWAAPFNFYERIQVEVQSGSDRIEKVWVYVPKYPQEGLEPSAGYLKMIIGEAKRLRFPESYITALEKVSSKSEFDLDPGFQLSDPGHRRPMETELRDLYLAHDRLREKLAELLP